MRGAFIWLLLVLVLGAVFGWLLQQDACYVLIQFHGYTVETSLWIGIGLLVSAVIGAGLLLTLLRALIAIVWMALGKPRGGVFAQWRRYWAQQKNRAANRAVADFYRGRWRRTLRPLARAARKTDAPLVYQLLAARCAEELGDRELSEGFLELAAADPNAGDVVAVARAEMAARRGDHAGALALLDSLNADAATHPSALRLQAELLAREQRWEHLAPRLPELRRHQVMPADALDRLELATQSARLEMRRTHEQPLDAVRKLWQSLSGRVRAEVDLTARYAEILCELGAGDEAASLLLDSLKNRPDARLIRAYGMSPANDTAGQLAKIETMLKREPENPALLLAAGRIAARNRLWGKARDYLQASEARADNRNEVRAVLASLPEKAAV